MQRCLQLAKLGAGNVAPNPMVGAVLVHNNRIIGEGYHQRYGEAHAEVNCINHVSAEDKLLINKSTLYVSLEPCAHYGKTPPCADLITKMQIPQVVIACRDSYKEVDGKGIDKLRSAGVNVTVGILEAAARMLNKRFFTFHEKQRPYIILKWAQSSNDKIANADLSKVQISNDFTNRLVHQWRSEEAAIMVGTNTALHDDPSLTNRLWTGGNPVRIIIDKNLKVPASSHLLSDGGKTIIFNEHKNIEEGNLLYKQLKSSAVSVSEIMGSLFEMNIQSVLVEGGTMLLQSFIDAGLWDEARIITNNDLVIQEGRAAPELKFQIKVGRQDIFSDSIQYYTRQQSK